MRTTKENIERLTDTLANEGHPIMIGDVLERITSEDDHDDKFYIKLLSLWYKCGFTKSFQQIVEESGFANETPKDSNARALAEFLLDIFKIK